MNSRTPTNRATKRLRVYRRAARIVENGVSHDAAAGYACNAIEVAKRRNPFSMGDQSPEAAAFKAVFSPGWETATGFFGDMGKQKNRDYRVLALCFMAAMVKAGDA